MTESSTLEDLMSVGEVAELAGVSVRTLHHYDDVGLLQPEQRSQSGYRLYGTADLERLHKILSYRELGFDLGAIGQLLNDGARDGGVDDFEHLQRQEALLDARLKRLLVMRQNLRKQMEARKMGLNLSARELFELFGDNDPAQYATEAEERWGDTDAYQQSQQRTKRYGQADWQRIQQETSVLNDSFVALMRSGVTATDPRALALAEEHRRQISRNFYDCSYEIHRGLGEMFLADPRFTKTYEDLAEGLASYVSQAIIANADTAEND